LELFAEVQGLRAELDALIAEKLQENEILETDPLDNKESQI
jgi:hypothetical protein